jgi:hypothetical protein
LVYFAISKAQVKENSFTLYEASYKQKGEDKSCKLQAVSYKQKGKAESQTTSRLGAFTYSFKLIA